MKCGEKGVGGGGPKAGERAGIRQNALCPKAGDRTRIQRRGGMYLACVNVLQVLGLGGERGGLRGGAVSRKCMDQMGSAALELLWCQRC